MMKVPKDIKNKMHKASKLYAEANALMQEIEDFFESNLDGKDEEILRAGNGISLEEIEMGDDVTDEFCEWAERGYYQL